MKSEENVSATQDTLNNCDYLESNLDLSGCLKLNSQTNKIEGQLKLLVKDSSFKFYGQPKFFKTDNGYHGIAFRYGNGNGGEDQETGGSYSMPINLSEHNEHDWQINDRIRVMGMNEDNLSEFLSLDSYFKHRLDYFKHDTIDLATLKEFDLEWNSHTYEDINPDKLIELDKPKLSKGDLILKLK